MVKIDGVVDANKLLNSDEELLSTAQQIRSLERKFVAQGLGEHNQITLTTGANT